MVSEKEIEAAREAWREYWSDVVGQYDDNKDPMEGMRRALEAAARVREEANNECGEAAHPAPQPRGSEVLIERQILEAARLLVARINGLRPIEPAEVHQVYDEICRALNAFTAGKPEPETLESVLLDAVRKIASTDLSGCANMTTAEIFGALSRMHETARVAVETAERILGRE